MKKVILLLISIFLLTSIQKVEAAQPATFLWTAPPDYKDTTTTQYQCAGYVMKYAMTRDSLINNWSACRNISGMPLPSMPGLIDSVKTIITVVEDTVYYGIKAFDFRYPVPNYGLISNILAVFVPDTYPPGACNNLRYFFR